MRPAAWAAQYPVPTAHQVQPGSGDLRKGSQAEYRSRMDTLPNCPNCQSVYTYEDGTQYVCPECAHEWPKDAAAAVAEAVKVIRDAVGNELKDGDTVTVIKDLKVKGSSSVVKVGTKVKNIRLVDGDHDIDCRIEGIGPMGLKSEFVKKVSG